MRNLFVFALVLVLIMAISMLASFDKNMSSICFDSKCFDVELATTAQQRATGLMFRESLDKDRGMLFVFDSEADYPFWMKNTLVPLDIIWMDSSKRVVFISRDTLPCNVSCETVDPMVDAKYVLEINAGESSEINVGDIASI